MHVLMHAEARDPSCSMLMFCDGFMHVYFVSSFPDMDMHEAGGVDGEGCRPDGRGGGGGGGGGGPLITALLARAVKHDWGHKVPVSLSIPGEISQSQLTVINVSGGAWCCRSRAGTAGVYCSFRGGKELLECSACRSIPKVNNNREVIVFVVKFVRSKQN